jgi:hypothetical protein
MLENTESTFVQIASKLGNLLESKNAAYGNAFNNTGHILRLLYPGGIGPEQYGDVALVVRILDKLSRIATNNDPAGESPYMDIAGYGMLGAKLSGKE